MVIYLPLSLASPDLGRNGNPAFTPPHSRGSGNDMITLTLHREAGTSPRKQHKTLLVNNIIERGKLPIGQPGGGLSTEHGDYSPPIGSRMITPI